MDEIVSLHFGQCGTNIGNDFWEVLCEEHGIDSYGNYSKERKVDSGMSEYQLERMNVYFNEENGRRYSPRSIFVDLSPDYYDKLMSSSKLRNMYNISNMIYGQTSCGNNWAKGHYTEGAEIVDSVLDEVRKEAEECDSLQGFHMFHSIGGGTGGGLGTLTISKIREEYPDRMFYNFIVFPSPKVSDCVIEPYNAVLSIHQLVENSDMVFCLDNEAFYDINYDSLKINTPDYSDVNSLVSYFISGVTSSFRFPSFGNKQLNTNLRNMCVNLVPFPRLHFLTTGISPINTRRDSIRRIYSIPELSEQIFDPRNMSCSSDIRTGKVLSAFGMFRGENINSKEVDENIKKMRNIKDPYFTEWIPDNFKYRICEIPYNKQKHISATSILNTSSVNEMLKRISEQFTTMFRRKAFLHFLNYEGMDEMEFTEAESNLNDLISEYEQYENSGVDDDGELEEEDGELDEEDEERLY